LCRVIRCISTATKYITEIVHWLIWETPKYHSDKKYKITGAECHEIIKYPWMYYWIPITGSIVCAGILVASYFDESENLA
jgi:hypothetical protein